VQNPGVDLGVIVDIIKDPRFIIVFCAGILYSKLTVISAEITYTKRWRHWAANSIMELAIKNEVALARPPE